MRSKTDQTHNGQLKKRQTEIVPKGKRLHWVPELKAHMLVDSTLSPEDATMRGENYHRLHEDIQTRLIKISR